MEVSWRGKDISREENRRETLRDSFLKVSEQNID